MQKTRLASSVPWNFVIVSSMVAVAVCLGLAFHPTLGKHWLFLLLPIVVLVASRFGGWLPGLVATILSILGGWFFLTNPPFSFQFADNSEAEGLAVYAISATVISLLGAQVHATLLLKTRSERAARQSESLLSTFVKWVPAPVAMLDREMRYLRVSDRWCVNFAVDCSQILGRSHYEIFPDLPERWKDIHRRCLTGETLRSEEDEWERAKGSTRWLRWEIRPWGEQDKLPEGILIFSEDITERKHMEAEIEAAKEQLIASARLSALGMMAGGIAHEINNPLAIIQAAAENILRKAESGSVQTPAMLTNCNQIILTADRISRIVRSLRQIAREGSADAFRPTPVREILEETLELCSERFRAHNIRLDVPAVDPQTVITCREVQICQVLLNLLQNAFDELVNREGDRWVKLDVTCRPPWVAISVSDSGLGIAPENRSHIMEPFFTTKPVGQGTGLGLSISRSIVLEHGGTLELDQSSSHTRFVMKLPLSGGT